MFRHGFDYKERDLNGIFAFYTSIKPIASMHKLLLPLLCLPLFSPLYAQTVSEVRTVHESGKVVEWAEPRDMSAYIYMGPVPRTWDNSSIAKPKMTCVMVGGNILYLKQKGGYDAYSSYKIDPDLIQKQLAAKDKFKVLEKITIEKGPQGYKTEKPDILAKFENPRKEGDWVLLDGKIPGESVKTFLVTRANDTQWVLKTYEQEHIVNYIIQVN